MGIARCGPVLPAANSGCARVGAVPKVKFTVHLIAHLAYMFYLGFILLARYDQAHPVITGHEVIFWVWTCARAIGEISEVEDFDDWQSFKVSMRLYLRDTWNQIDLTVILIVILVACLRLTYAPSGGDPSDVYPKPADANAVLHYAGHEHSWARTLYSLLVILIFMRVLQLLRYFSSVGVLTIW